MPSEPDPSRVLRSETVDENLPDEVRDVVRVEGSWHESCATQRLLEAVKKK
jgi:hypothetical protein